MVFSFLKKYIVGATLFLMSVFFCCCGNDSPEQAEDVFFDNNLSSSIVPCSSSADLEISSFLMESSSNGTTFSSEKERSSIVEMSSSELYSSEFSVSSVREVGLSSEELPFSSESILSSSENFSSEDFISSSAEISSSSELVLNFDFYTGADVSTVQEYERNNTRFFDVDDRESDVFTILKKYGFNAIRLRTFVSPKAKYGYAAAGCGHEAEAYGDKDHVVAYAQKVKKAGMALLLDIHYSDNWADPGKQIIPERWRNVVSSDEMADSVYSYTYDLISSLKAVGATPEMVQIGNETTPGILMHLPNNSTDCWGNGVGKASASVGGDMGTNEGKANAAKYFNAGIKAVKSVSSTTKTVLHIERIRQPETVNWWMGVIFGDKKIPADVMGFSAYTAYGDGFPDSWIPLFTSLTKNYPNLQFIVAEYNGGDSDNHYKYDGSRAKTNKVVRNLDKWIGAFFWEPTLSGAWGSALFDWKGDNLKANANAFEEYSVQF